MFSFNFSTAAEAEGENTSNPNPDDAQSKQITEANEIIDKLIDRSISSAEKTLIVNDPPGDLPEDLFYEKLDLHSDKQLAPLCYVIPEHKILKKKSDLIKGVYEGGFKVWECSVDLCRFLAKIIDSGDDVSSNDGVDLECVKDAVKRSIESGGSTMELGCGHGLPGCLILREQFSRAGPDKEDNDNGQAVIVFTDFNDYVLHHATIPNAQINLTLTCQEELQANHWWSRTIFAGGDWIGFSRKLTSGCQMPNPTQQKEDETESGDRTIPDRFDLILAAETTYTEDSCRDTAFLMLQHLKVDTGVGLVATKRFYFGVGGGTDMFSEAAELLGKCNKEPYSGLRLAVRTIQSYDTGNANIRDMLEVRCHKK